jgi:hypothetical protein
MTVLPCRANILAASKPMPELHPVNSIVFLLPLDSSSAQAGLVFIPNQSDTIVIPVDAKARRRPIVEVRRLRIEEVGEETPFVSSSFWILSCSWSSELRRQDLFTNEEGSLQQRKPSTPDSRIAATAADIKVLLQV